MISHQSHKNYINIVSVSLTDLLLQGIQKILIDDDEDDDGQLGVSLSSGCCLNAIALIVGDQILDKTFNFVGVNLENPDWKVKYASLVTLGAITEGPDKNRFITTINQGKELLLPKFQD